ncbi:MAG: glycoside hydrolase, partial [Ignavibacteria bacterium]
MQKKISLCIHGHFYQPPRENSWSNEISVQPSAAPFHDWNERIFQECYKPNSDAVIVDEHDNVLKRINNFEYFNFNFGPTLLQWVMKKHPRTYEKIIDADRVSVQKHHGHGNAIAMIYNHMIMPLANHRDKVTQVKWGLADFKFHFGRSSEGIWLPETACNEATVEILIDEGVKFIILDPSQAQCFRKIKRGKWTDVSS